MTTTSRRHFLAAATLLSFSGLGLSLAPPPKEADTPAPSFRVSAPMTHDNLTVFFLHGPDQIEGKILTLDEALAAKKIVVHETKNVSELSIENVSGDEVFVQAGDIVKGGQQDRTLQQDMLVPPRSGKLPLASFCVENGRWSARGSESAKSFSRSPYNLVGNDLKLACRKASSQRLVWAGVAKAQMQLNDALKSEVKDGRSATSLQLTLENEKLKQTIAAGVKALGAALDPKTPDAIGYAVVINGKVVGADVYANADLFRRLWPKLLQASVIEAVGEKKAGLKPSPVKAETIAAFLADAAKGKRSEKKLARDMVEVQRESAQNVYFETRTKDAAVLRRSYLAQPEKPLKEEAPPPQRRNR